MDQEEGKGKSKGKSTEKILDAMVHNPRITIEELSLSLELSVAGVEKNIRQLKARGLVRRIGPAKGGYWEVLKK